MRVYSICMCIYICMYTYFVFMAALVFCFLKLSIETISNAKRFRLRKTNDYTGKRADVGIAKKGSDCVFLCDQREPLSVTESVTESLAFRSLRRLPRIASTPM